MTVTRTYHSPLREEQAAQTRERILEALSEILADESVTELTVASVAEHAQISVRTAYRYFPTKEAMLDAFNVWMRKRFGSPPIPQSMDEVPDNLAQLVRYFEANEALMRASRTHAGRELRKRRKIEQVRAITKIASEVAPHLDDTSLKLRAAMLHQLIGLDAWLNLKDNWGLNADEIIEAVQWAIRALSAQLAADDTKAKKRR